MSSPEFGEYSLQEERGGMSAHAMASTPNPPVSLEEPTAASTSKELDEVSNIYKPQIRDFAYEKRDPNIIPPSPCLWLYEEIDESDSDREITRRASAPDVGSWGILPDGDEDVEESDKEEVKETIVLKFPPRGRKFQKEKELKKREKRPKYTRSDGTMFISYRRPYEVERKENAPEEFFSCKSLVLGAKEDNEGSDCESFVSAEGESQEEIEGARRDQVRSLVSLEVDHDKGITENMETAGSKEPPIPNSSPKRSPTQSLRREGVEGHSEIGTNSTLPVRSSKYPQEQGQPRDGTDQGAAILTVPTPSSLSESDFPLPPSPESDTNPSSHSSFQQQQLPPPPQLDTDLNQQPHASSSQFHEPPTEPTQPTIPPSPSPSTTPESLDERLEALFHTSPASTYSHPAATYFLPLSTDDDDKIPANGSGVMEIPPLPSLPPRSSSLPRATPRPRSRSPFPFPPGELDIIAETSFGRTSDIRDREEQGNIIGEQIDDLLHNEEQQQLPINHITENFLGINNQEGALNEEMENNNNVSNIKALQSERKESLSTQASLTAAITKSSNNGSDKRSSSETSRSSFSRKLTSWRSKTRRFLERSKGGEMERED